MFKVRSLLIASVLLLGLTCANAATTAACAKFEYNITPTVIQANGALTLTGSITSCSSEGHWYTAKYKLVGPNNLTYTDTTTFWLRAGRTRTESVTEDGPSGKGKYFLTVEIFSSTGRLLAGPETKSFTVD